LPFHKEALTISVGAKPMERIALSTFRLEIPTIFTAFAAIRAGVLPSPETVAETLFVLATAMEMLDAEETVTEMLGAMGLGMELPYALATAMGTPYATGAEMDMLGTTGLGYSMGSIRRLGKCLKGRCPLTDSCIEHWDS
jgi:hypothetical protein